MRDAEAVKRLAPLTLALFLLPSAALATGSPHDETERLNRADMALAKQEAARKSDLAAGWRLVRSGLPDDSGPDPCPSFSPDLSAFVITGKHETDFEHGASGAQFSSDIGVFRNVRDATRDFNASATRDFLSCLKIVLSKSLRQNHLQGRISSSRMTRTPKVGAQTVFYRAVATITPGNGVPHFSMYADVVALRKGRSQAVLLFMAPLAPARGQVAVARSIARRMR
jgi:hypothetical protein